MKLFVTGGTGVLGRSVVPKLVAAGHEVRAVSRREEASAHLRAAGAEPVAVDLFDAGAVRDAVQGSEAVLHLATSIPPVKEASRKGAWDTNERLRTEATENLVRAAIDAGATRFVKESISFLYEDRGSEWIDETVPVHAPSAMSGTLRGEELVRGFEGDGRAAVVLRFGLFYGGEGNRDTKDKLRLARWRVTTVPGAPDDYVSIVHVDDAAAAVVAALHAPSGTYNVCDDDPPTRREVVDAFAEAFGTHRLHPIPGWLVKLFGGGGASLLLASQRVSNRRFRDATGWAPQYPNARVGWRAVAAAHRHEQVSSGV
jgi:nucleoside-diphosphate-sugar epimerase